LSLHAGGAGRKWGGSLAKENIYVKGWPLAGKGAIQGEKKNGLAMVSISQSGNIRVTDWGHELRGNAISTPPTKKEEEKRKKRLIEWAGKTMDSKNAGKN